MFRAMKLFAHWNRLAAGGAFLGLALALLAPTRVAAQAAPGATADATPPGSPRRPSIVFILADDLGYGDLGCYGQTRIKTPNIDALAAEGMRFTSFYAGSTVCAPSRATLMTGRHSGHNRIRGNADIGLEAADVTLGQVLRGAGYATAAVGKWGLGEEGSAGVPSAQGFEEWFGYLNQTHAHDYYPTYLYRTAADGRSARIPILENAEGRRGKYADDYFTEVALNFARINAPDHGNAYKPFFLYLAYTIPHANNELGQKTGNGMEVPTDAPYSGELWPAVERNKAAMITRMDADIGRLMKKLEELKIAKNTLVIFASDNGPHREGGVNPNFFHSAGSMRGIKRDLYEGGIRVPFIAHWPLVIPKGATSDLPVAFWDVLPTLAEIARTPAPREIDGKSFLGALQGYAVTNVHEFLYWEFHEGGFSQAVRMGRWKGVRHGVDAPLELYDLQTDLAEKQNVAEAHPAEVAKITDYLKTARTEDPKWPARTAAENAAGKAQAAARAAKKAEAANPARPTAPAPAK